MKVVLDTSILRQGVPAAGVRWSYLQAFVAFEGTGLVVPDVVVREMDRHIEEQVRKGFAEVRRGIRTAERIGAATGLTEPSDDAEGAAVTQAKAAFAKRINDIGVVEAVPTISHEQVLDRLHAGEKPFKGGEGNREVGYRDYLIWETLLQLRGDGEPIEVAFITGNTRDFADGGGQLHPSLKAEAEARGVTVTLYPTVDTFIDDVVVPRLPASEKASVLLGEAATREEIVSLIGSGQGRAFPHGLGELPEMFYGEVEDVTVNALDVSSIDSVENVVEVAPNRAAAELHVTGEASIGFFVFKADAYAWADDEFANAGLSDWNDHYFIGGAVIEVEGLVRVEMEIDGEEAHPVDFEVIELSPT